MTNSWGWMYDGVNSSVPRNAGPECANYLTTRRHYIEGVSVVIVCLLAFRWAWRRAKPLRGGFAEQTSMPFAKKLLLICMTFTLGLELGFKLSSRSVVYILNPCHITTMIQIYLLIAKPSKFTTALFRLQLNFLNGPLLAYLFPEIESRRVTLERSTYYVQHGMMFVIPLYLLKEGGVYNVEALTDINWNVMGYTLLLLYHFVVLELFALPTQVNLNHMLCPAILDPFEGPHFRLFAVVHQAILCPLLCKIYCYTFQRVYEADAVAIAAQQPPCGKQAVEAHSAANIDDGGPQRGGLHHHQPSIGPTSTTDNILINRNHCDNPTQSKAIPHLQGNSSRSDEVISKKLE